MKHSQQFILKIIKEVVTIFIVTRETSKIELGGSLHFKTKVVFGIQINWMVLMLQIMLVEALKYIAFVKETWIATPCKKYAVFLEFLLASNILKFNLKLYLLAIMVE